MAFKQITFNYPKPDEYLGQFDNEQLQGTHTYDCLLYTSPSPRDRG